jgi:hypothetical protein
MDGRRLGARIAAGGLGVLVVTVGVHLWWIHLEANVAAGEWTNAKSQKDLRDAVGDVVRLHGKVVRVQPAPAGAFVTITDGSGFAVFPVEGVPLSELSKGRWLRLTYVWSGASEGYLLEAVRPDLQPWMLLVGYALGGGAVVVGVAARIAPAFTAKRDEEAPLPEEWERLRRWKPAHSRAEPAPPAELPQPAPPPEPVALEPPATVPASPAGEVHVRFAAPAVEIRGKLNAVEDLLRGRGLLRSVRYEGSEAWFLLAEGATPSEALDVLALAGVPVEG